MRIKILLCLAVFIMIFFSACSAENPENTTSEGTSTESITDEYKTDNEYTSVPPAQGLENEAVTDNEQIIPGNSEIFTRCFYGADTGTTGTVTGLEPLDLFSFSLPDKEKISSKPTEMISHSYGVAKEEKPHLISIENQQFFDENDYDSVCYDSSSQEKVLYLTFDCGYENGYTSKILDVLKEKNVKAAFFCTLPQVRDNKELIARMINEGHIVGNHSVNHPNFSTLSSEQILEEVKVFDDYLRENFGYSSFYFRFPEGKYSEKSLFVLNELGFKCVFWSLAYADWDLENQKGALYAYETVMARLHPGAVILLHSVSPDNANALSDIIDSAVSKGYSFRALEEM